MTDIKLVTDDEIGEKIRKYRVFVKIDEHNKFWIVTHNGKLIRNHTEEDLKDAIVKSYNDTNICPICREEWKRDGKELTDKSILYPGNTKRWINREGKRIGTWICSKHWSRDYNYCPDGILSLQKSLRDRRTDNINDDKAIFSDNCQKVTCKVFGVDDLNEKNDDYGAGTPIDHSPIPKGTLIMIGEKSVDLSDKISQTKGAHFSIDIGTKGGWYFKYRTIEYKKQYDIMILWCISKDKLSIERGYIVTKNEITKRESIGIVKDPSRGPPWYNVYRITDKKILEQANKFWKEINHIGE